MTGVWSLEGQAPEIAEDAWVAPGAVLVGRVLLHPGATVWFNAVLRGDNEPIRVGEGSNVQDGAVLHTDMGFPLTLGRNVTLGHKALVHGATVEDGALVGMGATVLNGAVIGAGALLGAGALVTEGKTIPPGMLAVGAPAKVIRPLSDAERAGLLATAAGYRANGARFRQGMVPAG